MLCVRFTDSDCLTRLHILRVVNSAQSRPGRAFVAQAAIVADLLVHAGGLGWDQQGVDELTRCLEASEAALASGDDDAMFDVAISLGVVFESVAERYAGRPAQSRPDGEMAIPEYRINELVQRLRPPPADPAGPTVSAGGTG